MKYLILLLFLGFTITAYSQDRPKYVYAHFSDKSVSLYPFYKIFGSNVDPSFTIGAGIEYKENGNFILIHNLQATWYDLELTGKGITVSTTLGYSFRISDHFSSELAIGPTITSFISARETFSLNKIGQYESVTPVHWMFGGAADLRVAYRISDQYDIYTGYRFMLEGKYTDILPVIPASLFSVGVKYHLSHDKK